MSLRKIIIYLLKINQYFNFLGKSKINISLQNTIRFSIILGCLIPIIILSISSISISKAAITKKSLMSSTKLMGMEVENLNSKINQFENQLSIVATDDSILQIIFNKYTDDMQKLNDIKKITDKFISIVQSVSEVERIMIITNEDYIYTNGSTYDLSKYLDLEAFKSSNFYKEVINNVAKNIWVTEDQITKGRTFIIRSVINSNTFKPDAVFIIILKPEFVSSVYNNLMFYDESKAMVLDQHNNIILNNTENKINVYNVQNISSLKKLIQNKDFDGTIIDGEIVVFGKTINKWNILSAVNTSSLTTEINTIKIILGILLIGFLFLAILVSWIISKVVNKEFNSLITLMKIVENGNLKALIKRGKVLIEKELTWNSGVEKSQFGLTFLGHLV